MPDKCKEEKTSMHGESVDASLVKVETPIEKPTKGKRKATAERKMDLSAKKPKTTPKAAKSATAKKAGATPAKKQPTKKVAPKKAPKTSLKVKKPTLSVKKLVTRAKKNFLENISEKKHVIKSPLVDHQMNYCNENNSEEKQMHPIDPIDINFEEEHSSAVYEEEKTKASNDFFKSFGNDVINETNSKVVGEIDNPRCGDKELEFFFSETSKVK